MIYPNKKPRWAAGLAKLNRKPCLSRILARIPYLRQVLTYHAAGESVKKQRGKEKQRVYQFQLSRAKRQILAYRLWSSIDRWPEIPAEVGTDE